MVRLQNVIQHSWEENFILSYKIHVLTINLPHWQVQALVDVSLFKKLIWKSFRHQNKSSIWAASPYYISCEIKTPGKRAKLEYFYRGTENLWSGNWNRHVCHKSKSDVERPSRSTEVNPGKKQKCCSLSCFLSQVQRDRSAPGISQTLGYLWTKHHQYTCEIEPKGLLFHSGWEQRLYKSCFLWVEKYIG